MSRIYCDQEEVIIFISVPLARPQNPQRVYLLQSIDIRVIFMLSVARMYRQQILHVPDMTAFHTTFSMLPHLAFTTIIRKRIAVDSSRNAYFIVLSLIYLRCFWLRFKYPLTRVLPLIKVW